MLNSKKNVQLGLSMILEMSGAGKLNAGADEWVPGVQNEGSSGWAAEPDSSADTGSASAAAAPEGSWDAETAAHGSFAPVGDSMHAADVAAPTAFDFSAMYTQLAAMSTMGMTPDATTLAALASSLSGFAPPVFDSAAAGVSDGVSQGEDEDEEMRIQLELEKYRRFLVSESAFQHLCLSGIPASSTELRVTLLSLFEEVSLIKPPLVNMNVQTIAGQL